MKEFAKVKEVKNNTAVVYMEKRDECSKCGMCIFPKDAKGVDITAKNEVGAKEGDTVIIDVKDSGKLLGIFLAFVVPLLLIGASVIANTLFINNELLTVFIAVASVIAWYIILSFIDKKLKRNDKYGTEILSVIKPKNNENQSKNNDEQEIRND